MDLNKIGKFISEERKKKNYTQKQLAEILNISDRTISKWECGKGLPDVSLLQPLCKELGISVNELLTGERLDQENYMEKAEQKILHLVEEKKENRTKLILILVMGLISIISFVTLIGVVDAYGEIISAQAKDLLVFIACAVFSVGLLALVEGVRRFGYYKCLHCGETFVPGFINYIAGINIVVLRFMRCPHCGKWRWCLKVLTKKERDESERT